MHQDDDSGNQQKVKVEFVAAHMQVVVQVFLLPTCWKSEIHTEKFKFLYPLMMCMLQELHNHGFE